MRFGLVALITIVLLAVGFTAIIKQLSPKGRGFCLGGLFLLGGGLLLFLVMDSLNPSVSSPEVVLDSSVNSLSPTLVPDPVVAEIYSSGREGKASNLADVPSAKVAARSEAMHQAGPHLEESWTFSWLTVMILAIPFIWLLVRYPKVRVTALAILVVLGFVRLGAGVLLDFAGPEVSSPQWQAQNNSFETSLAITDQSASIHVAPPLFLNSKLMLIAGLVIALVVGALFLWLLIRSRGVRTAVISGIAGLGLLAVLLIAGIGVMRMQEISLDATSTIVTSDQGEIHVKETTEIMRYTESWIAVLCIIIVTVALVGSFGIYVFLVSRTPSEISVGQYMKPALWLLPVVIVSGLVCLKYLDHLSYSTRSTNLQIARQSSSGEMTLPDGHFEAERFVRSEDDLSLSELEKLEIDLSARTPAVAESVDSTEAEKTSIKTAYPEWLDREKTQISLSEQGEKVFRFTVMSDLCDSNKEAVEDALKRVSAQTISLFGNELNASVVSQIPHEILRESAIIHTYAESGAFSTNSNQFPMYRVWLDCEVSSSPTFPPFKYWSELLVQHRLWSMVSLFGYFVLLFITAAGYFRLNQFSQGMYQKRLKLAAVSMVVIAGLGVTVLI